jgi:KDO2-lipid IV(A) lauroyltransferase
MDFRSNIEYGLFRFALVGLSILPYRWSEHFLRLGARWAGNMGGLRREVALSQLEAVYPEMRPAELADMVRKMYDHLGITVAEVLCAQPDDLVARVEVQPSWDALDRAVAAGRGAIVATVHLGNFELGGRVLAQRFPLLDVVKTQRNAPFDRYLQEQRLRFGIQTVPVERSGRAVLKHLQDGGVVALFMDQDAGKTGFATDFLGRKASTWPGAARISIRTGCPVIPVAILRNDDCTHTLHIGQPLEPGGLTDRDQDIRDFTGRISAVVEGFIRERPEQWFWVHRRWKGAEEARQVYEPISGN